MGFACYLAMTAGEIQKNRDLPPQIAYMACHFSPYEAALAGCPDTLPPGSLLILNDRIPPLNHDPNNIRQQLLSLAERLSCSALLLDFQRPGCEVTAAIAAEIAKDFLCPVIISSVYGKKLRCPVLLPPVPPDVLIDDYLAPWKDRPVWLELSRSPLRYRVTKTGASRIPLDALPENSTAEAQLQCHYSIDIREDHIDFTLFRTHEDIISLSKKAEALGVLGAIGLWQEIG